MCDTLDGCSSKDLQYNLLSLILTCQLTSIRLETNVISCGFWYSGAGSILITILKRRLGFLGKTERTLEI